MFGLNLPIFPEDTLAISITTTVLVGVWVVVFFNLRLGWILSGLVVPGYLVPLMITKPTSAAVILFEAIITFAIVWCISEICRQRAYWSSFFGRDRFFALVLVSILVRRVMDGWLLPEIGPQIERFVGGDFDHRNHLHSYGLIIVALIANYFWKPGLKRGLFSLTVTVGTTYLIVRFLLIEFTNFNVGSLQYMYEDVASSLLASPKSYIILVTTAFLASWMNLRYSWDYNGILVPSLLALQWYDPYKILASFVEAIVIFVLAKAVLKLPIWNRTTMEGGRKILLFFNVAFAYRLALCYAVPLLLPGAKVTDVFGFGYLLSTLLAIRAYEKNLTIRVTRASLQVSLMGTVAGSLVGFGLTFLPGFSILPSAAGTQTVRIAAEDIEDDITTVLRRDKLVLYRQRLTGNFVPPDAAEVNSFQLGLQRLVEYRGTHHAAKLDAARAELSEAHYEVQVVQQRYLYLHEKQPPRGWGLFVFDLENAGGMVVEVPAPLDEWSTLEAGLCLMQQLDGGALAIAGADRQSSTDGSADVLSNPLTIYGTFHRQISRGNVLEVRGQTREHTRRFVQAGLADAADDQPASSLWVKGAIPSGCRLDRLRQLVGSWHLHWRTTSLENVIRDNTRSGFAELVLTRADRRMLLAKLLTASADLEPAARLELLDVPVREWLFERKAGIAQRGTDLYQRATVEELLYVDEQVVKPLLRLIRRTETFTDLLPGEQEELQAIAAAAAVLDYRLAVFRDRQNGSDLVALAETDGESRRHWGTYVFQFGMAGQNMIEVPRPIYERNVFEFAAALFDRIPACAILIAGAHPYTNRDGSADVIRLENNVSMFNLVHQVLVRESGPRPMMTASIRAIRAPVDADVVVAMADGARNILQSTPLQQELLAGLQGDGLKVRLADGSRSTAGYEVGNSPQLASLAHSENKEFAALWLSPSVRISYRQDSEDRSQKAQCQTLGIPTITADLYAYLQSLGRCSQQCAVPASLQTTLDEYAFNRDIVRLRKAQVEFPRFRLTRFVDQSSRQAFLLIDEPGSELLPALMSLSERTGNESVSVTSFPLQQDQVRQFISSRASWLEVESKP
jgi:hypothetical protein